MRTKTGILQQLLPVIALSMLPQLATAQYNFSDAVVYPKTSDSFIIKRTRLDSAGSSTLYDMTYKFNPTTLNFEPQTAAVASDVSGCGTATITVNSASTGGGLASAVVSVVGRAVATDASGVATLTGLSSGTNWVTAAKGTYAPVSRELNISCTDSSKNKFTYTLNPATTAVGKGQVRIVLNWETDPADLDSHLTGPMASSNNRFHIYYAAASADVAKLDVDDVTSFGPETVTISPPTGSSKLRAGLYRYSVHHYSGMSTIPDSPARVRVIFDTGVERSYTPPVSTSWRGDNDVWVVFEMNVSSTGDMTFTDVNRIENFVADVDVKSRPESNAAFSHGETDIDYAHLPPKR